MQVKVRRARDGQWGFLETFNVYNYAGKGTITSTVCITPEGKIASCYAFRGEEFISSEEIDNTVGIDKYVKAKKPFYCKLSDGFIATIKAGYDFNEKKFLRDKTSFNIYTVNKLVEPDLSGGRGTLTLEKILTLTPEVTELMYKVAEDICSCDGDRVQYIKNRI